MLIKRPTPQEQVLWRAFADHVNKYVVDPAMLQEKLRMRKQQRPPRHFVMVAKTGYIGSEGTEV